MKRWAMLTWGAARPDAPQLVHQGRHVGRPCPGSRRPRGTARRASCPWGARGSASGRSRPLRAPHSRPGSGGRDPGAREGARGGRGRRADPGPGRPASRLHAPSDASHPHSPIRADRPPVPSPAGPDHRDVRRERRSGLRQPPPWPRRADQGVERDHASRSGRERSGRGDRSARLDRTRELRRGGTRLTPSDATRLPAIRSALAAGDVALGERGVFPEAVRDRGGGSRVEGASTSGAPLTQRKRPSFQ